MAGRSDIEAGRAHIMLYVKNSALVKGLNSVKARLQGLGTSILKVGGFLTGLGASIVGPLSAAVSQFIAAGSALDDMSGRTGISRAALGELKFAAEQSGASLEDVEKATKKMAKVVVDADRGLKTAKQSLALLGLSASDLKGKLPDEQLQIVADRLAAIEDPTTRTAAAVEVLGKSGTQLLPMVANLRAFREEARRLGIAPTEEASKLADALGDAFDAVKSVAGATIFEIGAALAPALLPAAEALKEILGTVNRWVRANSGLVRTVALVGAGLLAAGVAVTAIGATIFGLGTAFGLVASALMAIAGGVGVVLSPMGLLIGLVVGGIAAWARFTTSGQAAVKGIRDGLSALLTTAQTAIGGIGDALASGDLALAGQIAIKGLQVVFLQGIAALADMLGGTLGDAVGTIGTKVLQGDLAGVWQTVIKGMATLWADFAEGVVAVFTQAARAVTDLWQKT
ncbi:MAG: phage tail tape measure protein, partial [Planctomycetaceae bacterium]|nr:phage tail tape measure protein [Planctomycetaceae bacterium]